MDIDFRDMAPEQVEEKCYSMLGIRKKTPEEMARARMEEQKRERREQAWLEDAYYNGSDEVFRRRCPVCGRLFYTTNPRRIYDDYYQCSRYAHRVRAKSKRKIQRESTRQQCGVTFVPARSGEKYCCAACKQRAYRARNQRGQRDHTK